MKIRLSILCLMLLPVFLLAQRFELGLFVGAGNYQGDLVLKTIVPEETLPAAGLMFRYRIDEKISLRSGLFTGILSGSDSNYSERRPRGFSFENKLWELSIGLEWSILGKKRFAEDGSFKPHLSPFVFGGVGFAYFNTDVQGLPGDSPDLGVNISNTTLVLPVGFGLRYDLNERVSLAGELGLRAALNDYVDGVSVSANEDNNDWYEFLGLSFSYYLGTSSKKMK